MIGVHAIATSRSRRSRQTGVVLVTSLIILLVMTMIGVTAMQSTMLDERMAGNQKDGALAFEAAEAALRHVADLISEAPDVGAVGGLEGFWVTDVPVSPTVSDLVTKDATLTEYKARLGLAEAPLYGLREVAFVPDDLSPESRAKQVGTWYYSVTTLAVGSTERSRSMLQAVVSKRFN